LELAERGGDLTKQRARTVLVVDDDQDIREAVADCLEDSFTVICASNGDEALRYLEANPAPEVILLDLFMPVMDGWEFLRQMTSRDRLSGVPVVLATAAGDHWGYPVRPDRLVRKPFDLDRLLTVLRTVAGPS
jgi:putative two-component system response regulator